MELNNHNKLQTLVETVSKNYYDLGGTLDAIKSTKEYELLGYVGADSFDIYLEDQGVDKGDAYRYITTYRAYSDLGVVQEQLEEISFLKAWKIRPYIHRDNLQEWLDAAKSMTVKELNRKIKDTVQMANQVKKDLEEEMKVTNDTFVTYKFKATPEEADFIQSVLSQADLHYQCGKNLNIVFRKILEDYSAVIQNNELDLQEHIDLINSKYGTKLTVAEALASKESCVIVK